MRRADLYEDDELVPYEPEDVEDVEEEDTEEDIADSALYDNNEVSVKTSFLIFGIVGALMITIFILNAFHILPWWGTLISSLVVLMAIVIAYVKVKK